MELSRWFVAVPLLIVSSLQAIAQGPAQDKQIGLLLAVGDITTCSDDPIRSGKATAELVAEQIRKTKEKDPNLPVRVLALGDLAYQCGASKAFECFGTNWRQFDQVILPVPGNHEYEPKKGAAGNETCVKNAERHARPYFKYFANHPLVKPADEFYSVRFPDAEQGPWLLVGLNPYAGRAPQKLKNHLENAQNKPMRCVLAFAHYGVYSSGRHGHGQDGDPDVSAALKPEKKMRKTYRALLQAGASVLLAGHDHHYEQLGRATADGRAEDKGESARVPDGVKEGLRTFVVGTGGKKLYSEKYTHNWVFREAYDLESYGILKIELYASWYKWEFIPTKDNSASMTVVKNVTSDTCNRAP
jgi:hypothetical protein